MRYLLSLTFDTGKLGDPLAVSITGEVGGPPLGLGDGAPLFQHEDVIDIAVCVSAPTASGTQTKVSSLVLAAPPHGKSPSKRLSPFNRYDACVGVTEWGLPAVLNVRNVVDMASISALHPLTVTARSGAWTLTGYLSVLIKKEGGKSRPRLFTFKLDVAVGA